MDSTGAATGRTSLSERYRALLDIGRTLTGTLSMEELYRVIYRETSKLLEADGFFISLYDRPTDLATVVFYADRGVEQRVAITYRGSDSPVIRTGEPAIVEDRLQSRSLLVLGDESRGVTRSAISAALRRDSVLGTISVQSYRPSAYGDAELELLQGIADLAAIAVENAHYVEELERQTHEAEQIERIGMALVSSLDPEEVLQRVADAARDLVDARGAAVWLLDPPPEMRVGTSSGDVVPRGGATWTVPPVVLEELDGPDGPGTLSGPAVLPLLPPGMGVDEAHRVLVPLHASGEAAGVLMAIRDQGREFSSIEVRILERLATHASVALENARLHSSVQSLSLSDPLTELPNRRHLGMHLEREVAAARRGRPLTAVIFDLDNFKGYNDSLGHVAGDEALRIFARILRSENRAMNLVARYGGDEFVSILSGTTFEGGEQYAKRVRERVEADPVLGAYDLSVSCGVGVFDVATMRTGQDLVADADADLYRRKESRSAGTPETDRP